jgi:hypothetical protein
MWDFEEVRDKCIEELSVLLKDKPVERVVIAKALNIPEWLAPAFTQIVFQADCLAMEDANPDRLGGALAVGIFRIREHVVRTKCPDPDETRRQGNYCYNCGRSFLSFDENGLREEVQHMIQSTLLNS